MLTVRAHRALLGGHSPNNSDMPQVISNLSTDEHKALARRAKENRRTLGNQLVAEAFEACNKPVPEYLNAPAAKKTSKAIGERA